MQPPLPDSTAPLLTAPLHEIMVGTVTLIHEVVNDPQEEYRIGKGEDAQG